MLRQSEGFFEAFKAPSRELYFRLTINETKIYEKDKIKTVDVEYGSTADDSFAIGTTFSSGLKIVFSEIINDLEELDEIHAEIGIEVDGEIEYSSLGYFIISERVDVNRNDNITTVQCLDQMILMEQEYKSKLTYPAPIHEVALEIANLAGVEVDATSFSRLSSMSIAEPIGFTHRQAIGLIAQFEAGFATFNRSGKLEIRLLNEADVVITPDEYFSKGLTKNDLRYELGGIAVNVDEDRKLQAGSSSGSQISLENPLMNSGLLNNIWSRLEYLTFYPFTLQWRGNPALEIGDWIYLTDIDGNLFKAPILTYSLHYNGGLTAAMSADVESTSSSVKPFKSPLEQKVERIQQAIVKANGNVNFYGQSTPPENPRVNDLWFKPNGTTFDMYVYYEKDGVLDWHKEMHDLFGEEVKEAIESAQQDIAAERQRIDVVVDDMNTAVSDAGFLDLSGALTGIQQISQTAQSNAENALTHSLNAISDASTALSNSTDALSQVANIDVRVDDVEGTLELKADKQEVDTLSGIVDAHTLDIQANAEGLSLKANQDTVDTLAGTVTSLGTEFDIVAGQVNSRVWNTDIEMAIGGIEVGGRNLILDSNNIPLDGSDSGNRNLTITKKDENGQDYYSVTPVNNGNIYQNYGVKFSEPRIEGQKYTLSFDVMTEQTENWGFYFYTDSSRRIYNIPSTNGKWKRHSYTFTQEETKSNNILFGFQTLTAGKEIGWRKLKLEKGTKATDWTPAPEDTDAKISHIETEWTQTFDEFSQTVAGIDGRVSKQEQTVSGMESVVYDPETGLSSLNTQLANLIQVAVTGEEMTGAISVLENNINARVEKDDVINQINISDENILIQANKIMALGDVVVDGKLTITDEFIAPNAQIDGAKIADATIGSAKIASLDVAKVSGLDAEFVRLNLNSALGGNVSMTGDGIVTTASNGAQGLIQNGVFLARNPSGSTVGYIGYDQVGSSPAMTVTTSLGSHFKVRQHMGGNVYKDVFQLNANDGAAIFTPKSIFMGKHEFDASENRRLHIKSNESLALYANNRMVMALSATGDQGFARLYNALNMGGYGLDGVSTMTFSANSSRIYGSANDLRIDGTAAWKLGTRNGNATQLVGSANSSGVSAMSAYSNINMNGNSLTNTSDIREKTEISEASMDSLEAIENWKFVEFNWINKDKPQERQFGLIAQWTDELRLYDEFEETYTINTSKLSMMTAHGLQQLSLREQNTNIVASQALQLGESNAEKIERLEKRIEELEGVA